MKKSVIVLIVILLFGVPGSVFCEAMTGNLNFFLGAKQLDEDDWEPVEDHGEFGIMVDFRNVNWPVSIAIDLLGSAADDEYLGVDVDGTTSELCFGVRKIWEPSNLTIRPYVGVGIALIRAEVDAGIYDDDDSSAGLWLSGGVYWTLADHFNLGLMLRYSKAEVTLFDIDGEAGGTHFGLILGYHW